MDLVIINSHQNHRYITSDITTEKGVQDLIINLDKIDGLVYSAGVNDKSLVKYIDREKIDKIFDVNLFAPILLIKSLIRKKILSNSSSIVLISSISSTYATITNALYASSKGAINSLIRVLALELANKKIRVNGIMPGMINTQMIDAYSLSEEDMKSVINSYPLGRLGETIDIANGIIYLLSDASHLITGTNLLIDG